jgi:hypothetical protein
MIMTAVCVMREHPLVARTSTASYRSTVRSEYAAGSIRGVCAWQASEVPRQTGGAIAVRST